MTNTIFDFKEDTSGKWQVISITTLNCDPIAMVSHLKKASGNLVQTET